MDSIATCFQGSRHDTDNSGGQLSMIVLMQQQLSQQQQMQQIQNMQQLQIQQFQKTMHFQMQAKESCANQSEKFLTRF